MALITSQSPQGGKFTGSVTFTSDDGRYLWYTVEVSSTRPPAEQSLAIESTVRRAVQVTEQSLQQM